MNIAVVKYNAGNIYSVTNALRRLGIEPTLTDNPELLGKADKIIFPGQGNAKEAMACLRRNRLDVVLKNLRQPVLGICVGQQLLCRHSEEGDAECIGVFDAVVKKFHPLRHEDKVPAMGWQEITTTENPLLANLGAHPYVYFVHSYYVPLCEHTIATAEYILPYSACMHKDNFYTCQFHPEKSGKTGELILQNFVEL
ncbi:imidazole glycerol phosphate synthase, glutamine amidotransferase subunit [Segatella baroniae F0067]|uniref:Imidazole glycerol phosphate synthase subunit HisH n=1 Tax=Segatella baroniae F0067 TaxID=1115809 RepID=U2NJJ6_9BACT|nr:imidazole glycerol phosphate synthase subunit HisH [Segatella baroniae]ERK38295.1 imidazole glycerol phosphate synthase, glutamine amidotransferase subunit [Segatella baroniae F0067]